MSTGSSTLPDAMIDLVDRLIDAADRRGWRRRGKSVGGLRDAQEELVMRRAALIAALDVPAAWRDVAIERRRQIDAEGFDAAHDDQIGHAFGALARAGAAYAFCSALDPRQRARIADTSRWDEFDWLTDIVRPLWQFDRALFKLVDPRRDLERAGALILADMERRDRAAARAAAPPDPVPSDPTSLPPQAAAAIAAARAAD
ncbi:hypothetical protein [Methylobacterium sp. CCH5-D2]|uniref:hypothetical protein n=1 Tax=Methylobacterium sp. CCH5-D2 TaxID=1768765 RepID=UPI000AE51F4E|nr:hypothetical protein [Methylobacterium sp. CCH5-D2]